VIVRDINDSVIYKIVRKIADGGMGSVFEAVQLGAEGFEKVVALKMILDEYAADEEFVEMFIGEAKLVADLVHQNIVQIYNLGRVGNSYYMAMEYCNGINLEEFTDRHRELGIKVPYDLAAFVISRVSRGLEYAHDRRDRNGKPLGVVHRDISPKNVLLTMEGVVKVTDFGIAKAGQVMRSREGDVLYGKIQYMSPEQAQYRETDRRSDIFSLGIVFHEILTCSELFSGEDTMQTMRKVVKDDIPSVREDRPDLPPELERILMKALERDPDRRYPDAGTMAHELEYYLYNDRFGPSVVTLAQYLAKFFPSRADHVRPPAAEIHPKTAELPRISFDP
jgi:serine/threonine-protein kinase